MIRQAIINSPGNIEFREVEIPGPNSNEILIRENV